MLDRPRQLCVNDERHAETRQLEHRGAQLILRHRGELFDAGGDEETFEADDARRVERRELLQIPRHNAAPEGHVNAALSPRRSELLPEAFERGRRRDAVERHVNDCGRASPRRRASRRLEALPARAPRLVHARGRRPRARRTRCGRMLRPAPQARRKMRTTLNEDSTRETTARLGEANREFAARYPGESLRRQPVHTVYGGAHLFKSDTTPRLGALALRALEAYAPNFASFARALALPGSDELPDSVADDSTVRAAIEQDEAAFRREHKGVWLAHNVYTRVVEKLRREAVEDFRIDFEDGYGNRPDTEEDGHAESAAREVARGMKEGTLPPFVGIRIKPFTEELYARSLRTLDIFLSTLVAETGGRLADNFVVTLPKITVPEQVAALATIFDKFEEASGLAAGSLRMEMMVEIG